MLFDIDMVKIDQFATGERHRFTFKRWITDPTHKAKVDALRSSIRAYTGQHHGKSVHGPYLGAHVYSQPPMKKLLDGLVADGHIARDDIEAVPTLLLEWDLILEPTEVWIRDFMPLQHSRRHADVEAVYWKK